MLFFIRMHNSYLLYELNILYNVSLLFYATWRPWLTTLLGSVDDELFGDVFSWWVAERGAVSVALAAVVEVDPENGGLLWAKLLMVDITVLVKRLRDSCLHVHHKDTSDERQKSNIHLVEDMWRKRTVRLPVDDCMVTNKAEYICLIYFVVQKQYKEMNKSLSSSFKSI